MTTWPGSADDAYQDMLGEAVRRGLPLTHADQEGLWVREAAGRGLPLRLYRRFEDYVRVRNPGLLRYEHTWWILPVVDQVAWGQIKNLLVMAPPRYFKSEIFSRLAPGYFLDQDPAATVGLLSHSDGLALELSEDARDNYIAGVGPIRPGSESKSRWRTRSGGGMWAVGLGGQFMGKGFKYGIVDDPLDPEKAASIRYQRRFERFFGPRFLSRREPDARTMVVMQRLGHNDPVDYLLRREIGENTEAAPMYWAVLVLDEVRSNEPLGRWKGPRGLPETCTLLDVDPRKVGEILAPSRFTVEQVQNMQRTSGTIVTNAQRQQRPAALSGDFWKEAWFQNTYSELPKDAHNGGRDWDTAYTDTVTNAASAFVQSFRGSGPDQAFPIYIHDLDWRWLEFPELVEWMKLLPGPHYVEEKASGKSAVQSLLRNGVMATGVGVKGGKLERASAAQPTVAQGRIFIRDTLLTRLTQGEGQGLFRVTAEALAAEEPGGLDLNDAFVQAVLRHIGMAPLQNKVPEKRRFAFR